MPSHSVAVVKNRIKENLLRVRQLIEQVRDYRTCLTLLRHCTSNLMRIRSRMNEEKYHTVKNVIETLRRICHENNEEHTTDDGQYGYVPNKTYREGRGRPEIELNYTQLDILQRAGYNATEMAKLFHCSKETIYKRCYKYNLKFRARYTQISDDNLRSKIEILHNTYPNSGSIIMEGYLRSEGIRVTRKRIRTILADIDPIGTARRWAKSIKRRIYRVKCSNAIWHCDSHLKLCRFGFIVHAAVDGFSRFIVYLSCNTANTAHSVIKFFLPAVEKYGLPSRVRSDHGYENLHVAIIMNVLRGTHRASHITGPSTRNQRVERLWKDVFEHVIKQFYDEFYDMENMRILDVDNTIHRFALQKVYIKEINSALTGFRRAWNEHKLRTERYRTPKEMWLNGFISNINSDHTAILELTDQQRNIVERLQQRLIHSYGINAFVPNQEPYQDISEHTAYLDLTMDETRNVENILNMDMVLREKYIHLRDYLNGLHSPLAN